MANLVFEFETKNKEEKERILEALAKTYGYQPNIPDPEDGGKTIENPLSKEEFAKEQIKRIVTEAVHAVELQEARQEAEAAVTKIELK